MTAQDSSFEQMREKVIFTALGLAANRPWSDVTLAEIAQASNSDPTLFSVLFPTKEDVLIAHAKWIDAELTKRFPSGITQGSDKDRLFDVLMERFDLMQANRQALLSVLDAVRQDPKLALLGLPAITQSMQHVLALCGLDTDGWRGCTTLLRLMGVFSFAVYKWRDDAGADMPKTMAALDQGLAKAGF